MNRPYRTAERPGADAIETVACLYCGGEIDASGACRACRAQAGPREAVTSVASGCPRCRVPLGTITVEEAHVFRCAQCHGAFVGHVAWSRLVGAVRKQTPVDITPFVPPPPPLAPTDAALVPMIVCPACLRPMDRFTFGARSRTIVDVCDAHGIWLDAAELGAVIAFVRRLWEGGGSIPMTTAELRDMEMGRLGALDAIADGERRWAEELVRKALEDWPDTP